MVLHCSLYALIGLAQRLVGTVQFFFLFDLTQSNCFLLVFTKSWIAIFARFDRLLLLGISLDIHYFAKGEKDGMSFSEEEIVAINEATVFLSI